MFWNNFVALCNQSNTSPTAVANVLGIAIGSITKWKNGSAPRDTTLKKIADYFGVSPDSLVSAPIGSVDLQLFGNSEQLPEKEKKLLALYNKIEDKEGLIRFIERLSALSAEQQKFVFDNLLQGQ
jgi:transcriptional regulator with XRE-family HTH domain